MVRGKSAANATWYGFPLSSDSSCASSSLCFSIKSASRFINTPRCDALNFLRHGPWSNAARAAATALSTSAASASATCVITSPVVGLMVGNVFPDAASTHLLLISSFVALTFTLGSNAVVAVAITSLLRCQGPAVKQAPASPGVGPQPIPPRPRNQETDSPHYFSSS